MGGGDGRLKRQASSMVLTDVTSIVKDLKAAPFDKKEKVAHLMDIVALQTTKNPAALVSGGAIGPLVELLSSGTDGSQVHAASTLATIAAASSEYQEKIIAAGAIVPLVTLLRSGSNKAQLFAAAAVAELSEQRSQQEPMLAAGAVMPVVRLLRGDVTEDAHLHAAHAVANLSVGNLKAQRAFFEAGAVPLLLTQLASGKSQTAVASALAKLLSPERDTAAAANVDVQRQIADESGIAPLLALLSSMQTSAQVAAAEALSNLANGNEATQNIIAKAGGIGPLLALLPCKSFEAQAQGASALAQLTRHNRENQDSFSKQGGIPQLVALLTNVDLFVQAMGARCLTEVCKANRENQTLAASVGCIANLVEQLKNNANSQGVEEVKAEAVGGIWVLSDMHDDNKVAIAAAGGIHPTVMSLAGGTKRAQEHAALALASLGAGNVENQKEITALLVACLSNGSPEAKENATALLERLVSENPATKKSIATAGPMPDLIGLLKSGEDGAKRFALWSLSLSISSKEDQETVINDDGAVEALVAGLRSDVLTTRQQAAAAISRLASKHPKAQQHIAEKDGIVPLIEIVKGNAGGGGEGGDVHLEATQHAANALSSLASIHANGLKIVDSGGVKPLIALLTGGDNTGKQHAAAALARLATRVRRRRGGEGSSTKQEVGPALDPSQAIDAIAPLVNLLSGESGDAATEEAAHALLELADDVGNRKAITDAGGVGPLVTLLGSTNSMSQQHAKGVLVRLSIESANRALIIKQLVDMLSDTGGGSAQEQAAAALANLASESAENRGSIVDAGGIQPLLTIIGHKENSKAKEASLKAISKLAYNSETIQSAITAGGGIPLLVDSLASSSNAKEMMASAQLYSLAANALSQLAKGNRENQTKITDAGAIPSLVGILGAPVPDLQANAAECLGNLSAFNPDNQAAIARTGAIAPLCTLLREGADEVKEQAAAALWSLSLDNKPNKDTVAKLGGVEPLVTLLVTGTSDNSLDQATGALSSMSTKHMENRETIAKLIVARLASRQAMMQTPMGAVRLLSAVARMCHGSNANQAAIAKAGGVPPLIMWLSGGFDAGAKTGDNRDAQAKAQAAAADALLSMVSNNDPLQALISRSNGIQPLIELLSSGTADTQIGVSRLLWHLCGNNESATAIVVGGGVEPLCVLLGAEDSRAQELAATVMLRLLKTQVDHKPSVAELIAERGGVESLVKMLGAGSSAGQQQATCSLAEVALRPENRAKIAAVGGIEALVSLLTSNVVGTSETAARALANLARDAPHLQADAAAATASSDKPPSLEEGHLLPTASEGASRRQQIAAAGGIKQLIAMLSAVSLSSSIIARKMWELVSKVIGASQAPEAKAAEAADTKSSFKQASSAGGDEVLGVQEQASATLANIALADDMMQTLIIDAGGVPPLIALLRSSSAISQANAARAISHLCQSVQHQGLIVDCGAIGELVHLSKTGSSQAQAYAAAVISDLAKGAIIERKKRQAEGTEPAEGEADRLSMIAQAGGVAPLVGLLSTGDAAGKENAASALLHLSIDAPNRDLIAKQGGLPLLVQLLDDGAPGAHAPALAALARLSTDSPDCQTQIAKKLVALLAPAQSEGAHWRSAHALWELAAHNDGAAVRIVNAGAISPLVSLMGSGGSDVFEQAVGVLSCLADANPPNQLAIATGLVALLKLAAAEKEERINAMATNFAGAADIRTAIAEAGETVKAEVAVLGEGDDADADVSVSATSRKKLKRAKTKMKALSAIGEGARASTAEVRVSLADVAEAAAPGSEEADGITGGLPASPSRALSKSRQSGRLSLATKEVKDASVKPVSSQRSQRSNRGDSSRTRKSVSGSQSKRVATAAKKTKSSPLGIVAE